MGRRRLVGVVVSTAMNKTIGVRVERTYLHPRVHKYVRAHKKYLAHDEKDSCKLGDKVEIIECRPLSKRKHYTLNQNLTQLAALSQITPPITTVIGTTAEGTASSQFSAGAPAMQGEAHKGADQPSSA